MIRLAMIDELGDVWSPTMPWVTSPKTTCLPSNQEVTTVVMKN